MNIKRIGIIAWKDIVDSIKTPRLLIITITPLIIALCIQLFFGDKLSIRIGIYSPDRTELVNILQEVELVEIEEFTSTNALKESVEDNTVVLGVALPVDFDSLLVNNKKPKVNFFTAEPSNEAQAAQSLIEQIILSMSPVSAPIESSVEVLVPDIEPGISLRGDLPLDQYAVILWLIMGIVGNGVMLVPTLIVEERDRKTLDALLLSPASYYDVAAGKALVGVLYCIISSILIFMVQGGLSGNILFTITLIVLGSFILSLLGVFLGSMSNNLHILNSYGGLFVFILTLPTLIGMLGTNPIIKYLQFLPTYSLTEGIVYAVTGNTEKIFPVVGILIIEAIIILFLVVWGLRKRVLQK